MSNIRNNSIQTIAYEMAKDGYNRKQAIKIEATIDKEQDPDLVLDWLRVRVERDLGIRADKEQKIVDELQEQIRVLANQKSELEAQVAEARRIWEAAKAFLEKNGLKLPSDDIPF